MNFVEVVSFGYGHGATPDALAQEHRDQVHDGECHCPPEEAPF